MSAAGAGTTVSGDLGLSPGLAVSRTGPWTVGGQEYFGPTSLAATAKADALTAYNNLVAQTTDGTWSLNAAPVPGVWTAAGDPVFPGPTLTLTGGPSSVWVFQLSDDFTFTGNVVLGPGVNPCNVFWAVARDATIAAGSNFAGTLIAGRTVTVASGAVVNGRILSGVLTSGSLTTDGNTISGCAVETSLPASSNTGTINVLKVVVNDNGGTKTIADFPLFVNGGLVLSGVTNAFSAPGPAYTITETSDPNYTQTFSGDCDGNGQVAINGGDNRFCIVTNNDIGAPIVPVVPPLIDVVKVPSPLALPNGPGPVIYTYTVRNVGTVPMTDVTMVGDTCSPIVLAAGDTNGDAVLQVNETWVYMCSTTLTQTHTNTVVATGWANGISAVDVASATVIVGAPIVPPLIHLTKVPSPLALGVGGGIVTYTERITNPGTVALSNVTLVDDKCSPMNRISGDINGNALLDVNEAWTYTCQSHLTQSTTNTAIATGQANGITVRDLAVATVVVGATAAAPGLPNTGLPPAVSAPAVGTALLVGIGALSLAFLGGMLRKRTI